MAHDFFDTTSPSPMKENTQGQCLLKVLPNLSCNVWVDGEFKIKAEANKITKIFLNKGTFRLEFVSDLAKDEIYACTCKMSEDEELIEVDLDSIVKESRKRREETERKNIIDEIKNNMVFVRGGTFLMGGTPEQGDDCDNDEKPVHQVTVSDFKIGKYPVTQAQWKMVMDNNPSYFRGDNLPVESVSWDDVQDFILLLNALTRDSYRLPTEAEWEYAARGGSNSSGYKYSGSNTVGDVAWYRNSSCEQTHAVGTKSPNELGIYDMCGNIDELCSDWYDIYNGQAQTNPKGPLSGSDRVIRGGSWQNDAQYCRVSTRYYSGSVSFWGIRIALSL